MKKMKEVVKILGYEVGEEFNVILNDGNYSKHNPFKFTEKALLNNYNNRCNCYLVDIITGYYITEKIPFVPKMGEKYWTYGNGLERPCVENFTWANIWHDRERKLLGIVFRTEQEAKDYIPTWKKRLEGE